MQIIDTPNTPTRYASFSDRLFAGLIDAMILLPLCAVLWLFSFGLIGPVLATWLYFALMESGSSQATVGKRIMGIFVTDTEGRRITFWQGIGRNLVRYFSVGLFLVGIFLMFFTEKRQCLHDLVTNTLVYKKD